MKILLILLLICQVTQAAPRRRSGRRYSSGPIYYLDPFTGRFPQSHSLIPRGPGLYLDPYTGRYINTSPTEIQYEPAEYRIINQFGLTDSVPIKPAPPPEHPQIIYKYKDGHTLTITPGE